jgi:uroporphyrin-III C-methyltransferase/precorrin-2 dehydrogenase/sirohydrochlorin ferrochelatase
MVRSSFHLRPWQAQDFIGAAIAIGAFDNDNEAKRFAAAARAAGVPVNVIDKPAYCDFSF